MPLRPEDIENHRFTVVLRGYHTAEVDAFLRHLAAELRAGAPQPQPQPQPLGGGVEFTTSVPLTDMGVGPAFGRVATTIASLLQTAAESAAGIRGDAEGQARQVVEQAEREAAELRRQAAVEHDRARAEVARLLDEAHREAAQLRSRAQAEHDRLAAIDRDLRARLEDTAETLLRSLHQPIVHDPLPVLSLADEERRAAGERPSERVDS